MVGQALRELPGLCYSGEHMLTQNHAETAYEFLEDSNREFAGGDHLQASEKLWSAAAHAVMAVAQQREWLHRSHRALKNA